MTDITNIRYRDIAKAETVERAKLKARRDQLESIMNKGRILTEAEQKEKKRIEAVLEVIGRDDTELCERLFVGVRDQFNAKNGLLGKFLNNHVDGVLKGPGANEDKLSDTDCCDAALTIGLLMIDGALDSSPVVTTDFVAEKESTTLEIESLKKKIADIDHKIGAISAKTTAASDLKKALTDKKDLIKKRQLECETAIARLPGLRSSLDKEGEAVKLKRDKLPARSKANKAAWDAVEREEAALQVKRDALDEEERALNDTLVSLKQTYAETGTRDVELDGEIADYGRKENELSDEKNAHEKSVTRLEQKLADLNNKNPTPGAAAGQRQIVADTKDPKWAELGPMFFKALGEAQGLKPLSLKVLPLLAKAGDPDGAGGVAASVDAAEFASVMRLLKKEGVKDDEPQLDRRMQAVLNIIQNRFSDGSSVELGIDLPDLEDAAEFGIVPDNVRLMGPMICAAMFDELKAFEVVDKLVELFQQGMLTIGNGNAGKRLYKYWKEAPNRMSDAERRNFYAMTMGVPGGESNGTVNREFNDLWLRFVSSVSSFIRQNEVDKLLRASLPSPTSHQQIRKAARDLAVNLSLHGYGMAYYAALDLQAQIKFMVELLGDKEVMANYGARDMWQVVDQVATLELGGAKTSSRYRTLATCGAIITAWLANNADRIRRAGGPIIDIDEVRQPKPRTDGSKATTTPSDADLVNACELWLADTATGDTVIDQMAQPRETPVMTSRPVQIPAIAREMLAGLPGMGLGYQNTRH